MDRFAPGSTDGSARLARGLADELAGGSAGRLAGGLVDGSVDNLADRLAAGLVDGPPAGMSDDSVGLADYEEF